MHWHGQICNLERWNVMEFWELYWFLKFQDEVAHTLTENRVLQKSSHPFLTVSACNLNCRLLYYPWTCDVCFSSSNGIWSSLNCYNCNFHWLKFLTLTCERFGLTEIWTQLFHFVFWFYNLKQNGLNCFTVNKWGTCCTVCAAKLNYNSCIP